MNGQEPLPAEFRWHEGESPRNQERTTRVEYGLNDGAETLDIDAKRRIGKRPFKIDHGRGEYLDREHHVDRYRNLRFQPTRQLGRPSLEAVGLVKHCPGFENEGRTGLRPDRVAPDTARTDRRQAGLQAPRSSV